MDEWSRMTLSVGWLSGSEFNNQRKTVASNPRIQIEPVKIGQWHQRTHYDLRVDGDYVGRYPTKAEALRIGDRRLEYLEQQFKSLGEEIEREFF
jgi:hypothetical protein